MRGQQGAILFRPPHGSASGHRLAPQSTAIGAVGSTPELVISHSEGLTFGGCWVTFATDVDCYIAFGDSSSMAVANSSDWPLLAGSEVSWWCNETDDKYLSVIRKTGDGTLVRRRSNQ